MNHLIKISLVLFIVLVSACATMKVDLIAEGDVKIAGIESDEVIFSKFDVHQHHERTEVEVVVRPRVRKRLFTVGSINILITNPDGSQQTIVTDHSHIDRHRIGSNLQHAHFIVSIPLVLSTGTTLTVSYIPAKTKE